MATCIPSLGLGLLSIQQNEKMISENVTRELRALANYASRELDLWINENTYATRALSTSNIIIDRLSKTIQSPKKSVANESQQELTLYLRSVYGKLDNMLELTVVNTTGKVIASSTKKPTLAELPKDALVQGVVTSPPRWSIQYNTATLSIAMPILSYDDLILGALVAILDLQSIRPSLKDIEKSPPGDVLLLDANGAVLLVSYKKLKHAIPLNPNLFKELKEHPGESLTFEGISKEQVIGLAYSPKTMPITVVANRNKNSVYAEWVEQRNLFLTLVSIVGLIVAAAALYLGHSIVVPLQRLIDATKKIVKGDLEVQLDVTNNDELGRLTHMFNQMTDKLRQNHDEILAANHSMQQQNKLLETLSITDGLTGLYNRNKLNMIIADQLARFERNQRPFSALMIDVDYFKTLNDSLGHIAGDKILVDVSNALSQSIRSVDFAARYGGDEFVIILTETTVDEALTTAERIREKITHINDQSKDQSVNITLSIGIIQSERQDISTTMLLSRVDDALYEAKRSGRNQAYSIKPIENTEEN